MAHVAPRHGRVRSKGMLADRLELILCRPPPACWANTAHLEKEEELLRANFATNHSFHGPFCHH